MDECDKLLAAIEDIITKLIAKEEWALHADMEKLSRRVIDLKTIIAGSIVDAVEHAFKNRHIIEDED